MTEKKDQSDKRYLGLGDKGVDKGVIDVSVDVDALDGTAALTAVEERAVNKSFDRVFEVAVGADICWVLASQLQSRRYSILWEGKRES